jgi:hypothetical protein
VLNGGGWGCIYSPHHKYSRWTESSSFLSTGAPDSCNALNLGVEFFLLFTHQIQALLSFFSRFAPSFQFQSDIATGVRVMCKQNLSGHECCIMPNHISLSDFVLNRVRCLVPFRILLQGLTSDLWLCVPRGFDLRCGPAQPGSAHPWRPCPPPCAPPGPVLSFDFSRVATSLSPLWCPRF